MGGKTAQVNEAIKKFIKKAKEKLGATKIILFGSRARGDNLESSDVDLLVVSSKFEKMDFRERIIKVVELWDNPHIWLEPICLTEDEFQARKNELSIVGLAAKEGKVLA